MNKTTLACFGLLIAVSLVGCASNPDDSAAKQQGNTFKASDTPKGAATAHNPMTAAPTGGGPAAGKSQSSPATAE